MKVTFILPTVYMSGGIRVVSLYARALALKGHKIVLISPPVKKESLLGKVKSLFKGRGWPVVPKIGSHIDDLGLDHRVLDKWRAPVDSDVPDADVVIATWWETAEWVNALSDDKGKKIYLVQGHEIFSDVDRAENTYWMPLYKIVVSRWLQDVIKVLYRDSHCRLVENGVDHSQFSSQERGKQKEFTIGLLVSPSNCKNLALAIDSILEVKKTLPKLKVIAFGASQAAPEVPAWVSYEMNPAQDRIPLIYAACDAWLFTTRSEGFGLPILEAMACRTPVLATMAGAAPDIVSEDNGRLLPDSVESFVKAIIEFSQMDEQTWKTLSENAHKKSLEYSWDKSAVLFEKALIEIIGQDT